MDGERGQLGAASQGITFNAGDGSGNRQLRDAGTLQQVIGNRGGRAGSYCNKYDGHRP